MRKTKYKNIYDKIIDNGYLPGYIKARNGLYILEVLKEDERGFIHRFGRIEIVHFGDDKDLSIKFFTAFNNLISN